VEGFYYLGSEVFGIRFHKTMMPHGPTLLRIAVEGKFLETQGSGRRVPKLNQLVEKVVVRLLGSLKQDQNTYKTRLKYYRTGVLSP
jgi:hypothetical protein